MRIIHGPTEKDVKKLLTENGLPESDLTASHLEHFIGIETQHGLTSVIGVELYSSAGLLRSLAVSNTARNQGHGKLLVAKLESYAQLQGVDTLYLLTTTAEDFFERLGYRTLDRALVPVAIQRTAEYSNLCPNTADVMNKILS